MPIITAAGWKSWRGYTGTAFDATLAVVIPQAQAFIERYTGGLLDSATYTDEAHDGTGTGVVYLHNWPVTTLTSVKIRRGTDIETLPTTAYSMVLGARSRGRLVREPQSQGASLTSTESGIPLRAGVCPAWPVGRDNILVTYTAGYSDATVPVPVELQLAAYHLVDSIMVNQGHDKIEQSGPVMGNQTVTFRSPADAEASARRLLGPFRRSVL